MKRWHRDCLAEARRAGVERPSLVNGAKHPQLVGTLAGRPFRIVIKYSAGSSWFALRQVRADIKRAVRV